MTQNQWLPGRLADVADIPEVYGKRNICKIFCNVAAKYRCYDVHGNYADIEMLKGYCYKGPFSKITDTDDSAVAADALTAMIG